MWHWYANIQVKTARHMQGCKCAPRQKRRRNTDDPGAKNIRRKSSPQSALSSFCSQTLHRPLTHYVPEWKHWLPYYRQKATLNPAVYYLNTAYLYTASISLFKYLIICRPSKTSYPTFTPQSASITNFPLPIHETLVCFTNAGKTFTTVLAERPFRMTASLTQTVPHRCTCWRQSSINKSLSGPFAAGAYMSPPCGMST